MIRVGIVAALPQEARSLTSQKLSFDQPVRFIDRPVSLYVSGIGPNCARKAAQTLIADGAELLLSWGSAAGLDPELKPGKLIIPSRIINLEGKEVGITSDPHRRLLVARFEATAVCNGALLETSAILQPADKTEFYRRTNADAADMETAAIAKVAAKAGIAMICIRAVVDTATMGIPSCVHKSLSISGQLDLLKLLGCVALQPGEIINMIVLAQAFRVAYKSLRQAAVIAIDTLTTA